MIIIQLALLPNSSDHVTTSLTLYYIYIYTYIHIYIHTYTNTYIHTCIHMKNPPNGVILAMKSWKESVSFSVDFIANITPLGGFFLINFSIYHISYYPSLG